MVPAIASKQTTTSTAETLQQIDVRLFERQRMLNLRSAACSRCCFDAALTWRSWLLLVAARLSAGLMVALISWLCQRDCLLCWLSDPMGVSLLLLLLPGGDGALAVIWGAGSNYYTLTLALIDSTRCDLPT